jgi:hypothetical protein
LQLGRIATAVGVVTTVSAGDDNEDRKRLKEKLKAALESDRRNRIRRPAPPRAALTRVLVDCLYMRARGREKAIIESESKRARPRESGKEIERF